MKKAQQTGNKMSPSVRQRDHGEHLLKQQNLMLKVVQFRKKVVLTMTEVKINHLTIVPNMPSKVICVAALLSEVNCITDAGFYECQRMAF